MIKQSIALVALSALAIPVQANELKDYIYSNPVLAIVHDSGTTINFKGDTCDRAFGSYNASTDTMIICIENHESYESLGDTIRHEAMHVIQACNRGPVLSIMDTMKYVTAQDKAFVEEYPHAHQHSELEANIGARNLTDQQVADNVSKFCFE